MMKKERLGIAIVFAAILFTFAFLSFTTLQGTNPTGFATTPLQTSSITSPDLFLSDGAKIGTTITSDPAVLIESITFEEGYLFIDARQTGQKPVLASIYDGKNRRKIMSPNETTRFHIHEHQLILEPTLTIGSAQYAFHMLEYPLVVSNEPAVEDTTPASTENTLTLNTQNNQNTQNGISSEKTISTTCGSCADCTTCMGGTNTTLCTLTGDISSATTCITVGNSSRTLDCLGSTISFGSGGSGGVFGITATSTSNITITNCRVIDTSPLGASSSPIRFLGGSNYTISNNIIQSNGTSNNFGILLDGTSLGNINDNIINTNGSSGDNDAIRIQSATSNVSIFDNQIRTNSLTTGHGVRLLGGACGTSSLYNAIENNTIVIAGRGVSGIGVSMTFPTGLCPSPGRIWNYTRIVGNTINMINNLCCGIGIDLLGTAIGTNVQQIRNTIITDNTIYVNGTNELGIKLCSNCNGTQHVAGNTIITNGSGFTANGFWPHNVSTTNTINGSTVYFYGGSGDSPACPGSIAGDAYHATLINCSGVSSSGLFVNDQITAQNADGLSITNSNLIRGVSANGTSNLVFTGNTVGYTRPNAGHQAYFEDGTNALVEYNTFLAASGLGCDGCTNGEFRYNSFFTDSTSVDAMAIFYLADYVTGTRVHNNTFQMGAGIPMDIYGHDGIYVADNNITKTNLTNADETINLGELINLDFTNNFIDYRSTGEGLILFSVNLSRLYNNTINGQGNGVDGNDLFDAFDSGYINLTQNVFYSTNQDSTSDTYMITCFECSQFLINNNTFRGSGAGIFGMSLYESNLTVTDNSIVTDGEDLAGFEIGSFAVNAMQVNITNNTLVIGSPNNSFHDGFYLFGGLGEELRDTNISNNTVTVYGNDSRGVYFDFHINANTFANNTFHLNGTNSYVLRADPFAENNTFAGNIFNATNWFSTGTTTVTNFTKSTFNFNNLSVTFNVFNINGSFDLTRAKLNTSFGIGGRDQLFVNSSNASFLNTSATIRFRNVIETDPTPLADYGDDGNFVDCLFSTCVEDSFIGGVFKFNVTSFTAYAFTENNAGGNGTFNVSISKTDTTDPTAQSTTLNYTLEVNVTGGTAYNLTINETYPPETTFISATPAPSSGNNIFILGNLTNTTTTINISLFVLSGIPNGTLINNTVFATFQNESGDTLNLSLTENTTVLGCVISGSNVSGSNTTNCTITTSNITTSTIDISTITDSNVTNSTLNNTNVFNSTINDSTVNDSIVNDSIVNDTTLVNTTAINTTIDNGSATNSTFVNTTITNGTTTNTTATNTTITNGTLVNTTITDSNVTNGTITNGTITNTTVTNGTLTNTTATNTTVNGSTIVNTTITDTNATNSTITNGTITDSNITNSTVTNATVTDSNVTNTTITNGNATNSTITNGTITDSNVTNGTITNGTITDSNITNSTVTNGTITDTNLTNSTLTNGTATNSTITDSNITNSTITNSSITNATITNITVINATITGDTCTSGTIVFNGQTFTCPANLSTIYATPPPTPPAPAAGGAGGGGSGSGGNTPIVRQNQTPSGAPIFFRETTTPRPTQQGNNTLQNPESEPQTEAQPAEQPATPITQTEQTTLPLENNFIRDNKRTLSLAGAFIVLFAIITVLLTHMQNTSGAGTHTTGTVPLHKLARAPTPAPIPAKPASKTAAPKPTPARAPTAPRKSIFSWFKRKNTQTVSAVPKGFDSDIARLNRELRDIEKLLKKK